ncbi:hypothetical protein DQ04_05761060 [Trypanosoma grayi]|uniref:hypothetical protein n=1 Tax=Trypanosoma grayi TaxID=71804 RepID=UPI0004F3FB6D|nr:hypothetical protein DQ04_05761060 [Trypanosoma grayi]KEG09130.1 hypothetical protein DQ04_05761060 [Trypanosoma grayi]
MTVTSGTSRSMASVRPLVGRRPSRESSSLSAVAERRVTPNVRKERRTTSKVAAATLPRTIAWAAGSLVFARYCASTNICCSVVGESRMTFRLNEFSWEVAKIGSQNNTFGMLSIASKTTPKTTSVENDSSSFLSASDASAFVVATTFSV